MRDADAILICGCDESGRGCLAGPVVAAAVILDPTRPIEGLADSKKLSARRREELDEAIKERALSWAVAQASVAEIDALNILHASLLAMKRAVEALEAPPHKALIDGNRLPALAIPAEAIVGGDATVPSISAASILAKVERDRIMLAYHRQYPHFSFHLHKSYSTKLHLELLEKYGPLPIHRASFGPVATVAMARAREKSTARRLGPRASRPPQADEAGEQRSERSRSRDNSRALTPWPAPAESGDR